MSRTCRRTSTRATTSSSRSGSTWSRRPPSWPRLNKDIWFIGVDHNPCIDANGDISPDFSDCSGDLATLIPNYIAINYQEDQAGYLAGIVAASASKSGIIGAVGGVAVCGPCVRYIQGFYLGAQSVNPAIKMKSAWVSASDFVKGFADQAGGTAYGEQFIKQNPGIDVVFQVAGLTGNGVIDAACAAGINAIGVDVDQYQSYAASQACILTSAEKHLAVSVSTSIQQIARKTAKGGLVFYNAANDGIGVVALLRRGEQAPGRHPDQDRRGARRHEGRLRRHLPAGPRLRQDPGAADRQLIRTL